MITPRTLFVVDDDIDARDSVCALAQSMGLETKSFASAEEFLAADNEPSPPVWLPT